MANTPIKLNDGTTIPWLGFGTGTALYGKDTENMIVAAIKAGFTHLDAAQVYANEDSLGAGIVASGVPRSQLYITTKFNELAPGQTLKSLLQDQLKKLKVDYVDLYLIHTPVVFKKEGELKKLWTEAEELKKEGLTRSIGVSNFRIKDIEAITAGGGTVPAINQIEYHPHLFKESQALLEFHAKHGIVTESYGGQSPIFRSKGTSLDAVLTPIAERLSKASGKTIQEGHVLMQWQKAKGIVFVTTTSKESRLHEYIAAADVEGLTADEVKAIDEAGAQETHRHFTSFWPSD